MRSCPCKLDPGTAHWITRAIGIVCLHVCDMRVHLSAGHPTEATERARVVWLAQELRIGGRHVSERHRVEPLAIIAPQDAESGLAETHSLIEHRVEHRHKIARRGIDDL